MKRWWNWRRRDEELEKEIQHHLRMAEEERVERGAAPSDARAGARREFGNVGLAKELARDAWGWRWLENLFEDLRYGMRTLRKSPGFAATAILTLALGIGANSAIFSLFDAALLRAIPVRDAGQLVLLQWKAHAQPNVGIGAGEECEFTFGKANTSACSFSEPFFREIQNNTKIFSSAAAFGGAFRLVLSGNGPATELRGAEYVTGGYFETLRIKPYLGRLLTQEDDTAAAPAVVVLSFRYWRSEFGGSQDVLGKTIQLNRVPFTIVGVTEKRFDSLTPGKQDDLWLPITTGSRVEPFWDNREADRYSWWLMIVGRLKQSEAANAAGAELSTRFHNETLNGDPSRPMFAGESGAEIELRPIEQGLTGARTEISAPLYVMMLVVGIVLLIACANVAGLLLARATARQKEMAVRFALGASRGRILKQLLTESLMLSVAGAAMGMLFANWCLAAIVKFLSENRHGAFPFTPMIDTRVLLFTGVAAMATGVLFGLAPAVRGLRVDLTPSLKEGSGSSAQGWEARKGWVSTANSLVIAQVALSIVVMAGAGLLMRTLQNLKNIDPGFDPKNVLTFRIDSTPLGYGTSDADNLYHALQERLTGLPGVASVSYSWSPLLSGGVAKTGFPLPGKPKDEPAIIYVLGVGPGFFHTIRVPVLAGREFNAEDFATSQRISLARSAARAQEAGKSGGAVAASASPIEGLPPTPAIVNETLVRRYLPPGNPLGQVFGAHEGDAADRMPKSSGWRVAGIVRDAKYAQLRQEIGPTVYVPSSGGAAAFSVRTAMDPTSIVPQVRSIVEQMDANLPVTDIRTEAQQIDQQIFKERLLARLAGFFGGLALTLACIGLYGLISYEVARRTREIGIRSALGAAQGEVLRLVLLQGMRLALVGAALGTALAFLITRYAQQMLFGVQAADPLTFAGVVVILFSVALLACMVPARRAMQVDPVVALRYE